MTAVDEKVGEAFVELRLQDDRFDQQLKAAENRMKAVGENLSSIGKILTKNISLPMMGVSTTAGTMAASFDESMEKINALVGVGQDQVDSWREDIKRLAAETGRSSKELANALFFITSAGFKGSEAISVLEASAKGAATGMGQTKQVADAATSAVNAYGEKNLSAASAVDTLVATVREGKLETEDLTGVIGQLVPLTSQLGISFQDTGAALASMTKLGMDANQAATALRGIMRTLIKATPQTKKQLEEAGLSLDDLRQTIRKDGLIEGLQLLRENFKGNEEALGNIFPRIRGLIGFLSIMGKNSEEAARIQDDVRNSTNALGKAFEDVQDSAMQKFNESWQELKNALIDLGAEVLPVVIPIIEDVADSVSDLRKWFKEVSDTVKRWMVIIGGLATALGPALIAIGNLIAVIGTLSTTFMAMISPLTIAVATVIGAIIGYFSRFWDSQKSIWNNLVNIWNVAKKKLVEFVKFISPIINFFRKWGTTIINTVVTAFQYVIKVVNGLISLFNSLPPEIKGAVVVFGTFVATLSLINSLIGALIPGVVTLSGIMLGLGLAAGNTSLLLKGLISMFVPLGNLIIAAVSAFQLLSSVLMSPFGAALALVIAGTRLIHDNWNNLLGTMKVAGAGLRREFQEIQIAFQKLVNTFVKGVQEILNWLNPLEDIDFGKVFSIKDDQRRIDFLNRQIKAANRQARKGERQSTVFQASRGNFGNIFPDFGLGDMFGGSEQKQRAQSKKQESIAKKFEKAIPELPKANEQDRWFKDLDNRIKGLNNTNKTKLDTTNRKLSQMNRNSGQTTQLNINLDGKPLAKKVMELQPGQVAHVTAK